jgi:cystathionine gamma-synthase/cystathionine gamma-lyase/cystathionine beta-lyase
MDPGPTSPAAGGAHRIDTIAIHGGEERPTPERSVAMPIYQSSTFVTSAGDADYHDIRYIRLSNTPNHLAVHRKLALLEGCEDAVVTASGMAAITTTLMALLSTGDHLIAEDCLYGGTHDFLVKDFPSLGLEVSFMEDPERPEDWSRLVRPATRAIYVESVSNPLLRVIDLERVVELARAHGLVSIIDNTFPSPVNFDPARLGFDLVLHSATKYLNGHTDLVAGAVVGRRELVRMVKRKLDHLGGTLDPHGCALLHRGLKTLCLRVRAQNENALALARRLERHPGVESVIHPGLESHPDHLRARRLFRGFGGVLSLTPRGGLAAAERLLARLRLPFVAPSLGGVETLVTRPAITSHSGLSAEARRALGITDSLVRVSVGIEAVEDLIADFEQALD